MGGLDREYEEGFRHMEKTLMYAAKRLEDFGNHGQVTVAQTICGKFECGLPNRIAVQPHGFTTLRFLPTETNTHILRPLEAQ